MPRDGGTRLVQHGATRVRDLVARREWRALREFLSSFPPPDIAELISELPEGEMVIAFRLLPRDLAAEVLSELDTEREEVLLEQLGNRKILEVLLELPPDERTELLEELPGRLTQKLLNILPPHERQEALELLGYPENSVGRLMTPDYVALKPYWSIDAALEHIRRFGRDAETVNMVYVVDEAWRLLDDIPLRRVILARPGATVESIMDGHFVAVEADADQEEAIRLMEKYDLIALPVVDRDGVLLGIVTVDDILDVLEEEFTEDVQKGASVVPLGTSYAAASTLVLFRKRVVWLLLLALAGFLSGSVISAFEEVLGKVIALAAFIPVLIDTGGNTGTQSATLIIRALATGELTLRRWLSVVAKESTVGCLLGTALGGVLYLWSYLWKGDPRVSVAVGLAVVFIVLFANLVGSLLPIILTKLRLDPAVVSSPLITTVMDVTGLLIYFGIAAAVLR
ncbi:MAG: magnesium transporter [Caldiserica bacterium]|nr:magnesium transporter [Caldisericota bacterium]